MAPVIRILVAGLLGLALAAPAEAAPQRTAHSTVDLVAEQSSLPAEGGSVTLGFHLDPNATWHAYWTNPGDAGKGPAVTWTLPDGFAVGELAFPTPHLLPFGELNTYGFEDAELFLAEMTVPAGLAAGEEVQITGAARWVVCDDEVCVPERATLSLTMTIGDGAVDAANAPAFAAARARQPEQVDWPAEFSLADGKVNFAIAAGEEIDSLEDAYLFIESRKLVRYGTQSSGFARGALAFTMDASKKADGQEATRAVLTYTDADGEHRSVALDIAKGAGLATAAAATASGSGGGLGLATALVFAFLGGVILNLMPCVFPILSMKALSLVNMGHSDRKAARDSGVFYTLGILVMFAVIGIALIALRSAGEAIGWGFQLQSTGFLVVLTLLMVAIGLNLFGVFEFGTRIMGVGQGLTEGGERKSAFFTGLLAVVVATPCTAPFMAGALGYALAQPAAIAVSIFLVMGVGLAFPYLVLSFVPAFGRLMPKPGAWMETFKHILAFPMFLVAIWLMWVIGGQLGSDSVIVVMLAVLLFSFALWAYGKGLMSPRKVAWNTVAVVGIVACIYASAKVETFKAVPRSHDDITAGTLGGLELERFDPERVRQYIADGQPTFVYFTADWCVSCKVNERVALATDTVAQAFSERGIKVVEGDWTAEDPIITEWLEMYDRIGVPLYLYFPEGASLESVTILPQILTPGLVVDAIVAADQQAEILYAGAAESTGEVDQEEDPYAEYKNFRVPDAEPDWLTVQTYIDLDAAWHEIDDDIKASDASQEEKDRRREEERGPHPEIVDAQAAATAIVKVPGHEKLRDAAMFLIEHTRGAPGGVSSIMLGLRTMAAQEEGFDGWPAALFQLDIGAPVGWFPEVEEFFIHYEENVPDEPLVRATARYYAASRQMRFANAVATPAADRPGYRQRGIDFATGLSKGVENEELIRQRRFNEDGEPIPFATMARAEEHLLYNLNFLTVGAQIPAVSANTLEGNEESLAAYRGQTVLLDFWATWCGPCIKSLPKLNEIAAELPDDQFEILSISVDKELGEVLEFQQDTPMPWANWYIGPNNEILRRWNIRGFPTYILVDGEGTIMAKTNVLDDALESLIRRTTCGDAGTAGASC